MLGRLTGLRDWICGRCGLSVRNRRSYKIMFREKICNAMYTRWNETRCILDQSMKTLLRQRAESCGGPASGTSRCWSACAILSRALTRHHTLAFVAPRYLWILSHIFFILSSRSAVVSVASTITLSIHPTPAWLCLPATRRRVVTV